MATIEEIKRVSGPRAKRVPIIGSRVLYGLCKGTLPDGVDYATWRKVTLAPHFVEWIIHVSLIQDRPMIIALFEEEDSVMNAENDLRLMRKWRRFLYLS